MIIVCDVGGTKISFGLYDIERKALIFNVLYYCKEFSNFYEALDKFKKEIEKQSKFIKEIRGCVIGLAGYVINGNQCKMTNLHWKINVAKAAKTLSLSQDNVFLINDAESWAYYLISDHIEEYEIIKGSGKLEGNKALISVGTGLGEACLFWDGLDIWPFATEGGKTCFSPTNNKQIRLFNYAAHEIMGVPSFETFLSGNGLALIYNFISMVENKVEESDWIKQEKKKEPLQKLVTRYAEKDVNCSATIDLFLEILGCECANLVFKMGAVGGVYLCGGLIDKLLFRIKKTNHFQNAFVNYPNFSSYLDGVRISLITEPYAALIGAANFFVRYKIVE